MPGAYSIGPEAVVPMSGAYTGLNCNDLYVAGTLLLGTGEIDQASEVDVPGILDAGDGLIRVGGSWRTPGIFLPGSSTVRLDGSCSSSPVIVEPASFCKLQLGSSIEYRLPTNGPVHVECELDLGNQNRLTSSGPGNAAIVLGPDALVIGEAQFDDVRIVRSGVTGIPAMAPVSLGLLPIVMFLWVVVRRRLILPREETLKRI